MTGISDYSLLRIDAATSSGSVSVVAINYGSIIKGIGGSCLSGSHLTVAFHCNVSGDTASWVRCKELTHPAIGGHDGMSDCEVGAIYGLV